jgi:hypothetical protein
MWTRGKRWENFLANAFVNVIAPGFDREVAQAKQAHS